MVTIDAWTGRFRSLDMQAARQQGECPCCGRGQYEYLSGAKAGAAVRLCGRNAVQIAPSQRLDEPLDFRRIAARLPSGSRPRQNEFLLRFEVKELEITLFSDGRAIVKGTEDAAAARTVYAKYVGA
jgi:adenylyltransferase/sulfurtransferase